MLLSKMGKTSTSEIEPQLKLCSEITVQMLLAIWLVKYNPIYFCKKMSNYQICRQVKN